MPKKQQRPKFIGWRPKGRSLATDLGMRAGMEIEGAWGLCMAFRGAMQVGGGDCGYGVGAGIGARVGVGLGRGLGMGLRLWLQL